MTFQNLVFPIRQAVYLDETGVNKAKSVSAAVLGDADSMRDYRIFSADGATTERTGGQLPVLVMICPFGMNCRV